MHRTRLSQDGFKFAGKSGSSPIKQLSRLGNRRQLVRRDKDKDGARERRKGQDLDIEDKTQKSFHWWNSSNLSIVPEREYLIFPSHPRPATRFPIPSLAQTQAQREEHRRHGCFQGHHPDTGYHDVGDWRLQYAAHQVSGLFIPLLVSCPSLIATQDNICVRNCDDPDPLNHQRFEHPVLQTAQMFVGEMGTWLFVAAFAIRRRYFTKRLKPNTADYEPVNGTGDEHDNDGDSIRSSTPMNPAARSLAVKENRIPMTGWRILLLSLPSICDICGTSLMNVGLLMVAPSIYQMTRGALVLFVGLFSVLFLRRRLHLFQWFALVTVVLGVGVVGLAGAIYKDHKAAPSALVLAQEAIRSLARRSQSPEALRTIIGIFLIAGAQIFTASQFVLEEYILEKYALEPLKVVGWEGIFGFVITAIAMVVLHLAVGRTDAGRNKYFDLRASLWELTHIRSIGVSTILIMISIGYDYSLPK